MSTVLITGIAGLLGSRFARYLLEHVEGVRVIGIDSLEGGYMDNVPDRVFFKRADVRDDLLDKAFEVYKPEYVYHFAAYAAECLSPFIRCFNYSNNLEGTANVVNCCIRHNVKRLVFTSSMAVYGRGIPPFRESDRCEPIDPYGVAKHACERDIEIANEQHGLDYCIIRPHNVYGEGQNIWDRYRNVLGIWMLASLNKQPINVYGDGEQTRAFSYIGNCVAPLWRAAIEEDASKQIINLGGEVPMTLNQAAACISAVTENADVRHLEARHEVKHAYATTAKSKALIGYREGVTLTDGITRMWQWAQAQPKRERKRMLLELDKNLYGYWAH